MDFVSEILNFSIIDVLDIILVASLLYYAYKLLKGTVAINIFIGIILIYLAWRLTVLLDMELLSGIIGGFMSVGIIALIVWAATRKAAASTDGTSVAVSAFGGHVKREGTNPIFESNNATG